MSLKKNLANNYSQWLWTIWPVIFYTLLPLDYGGSRSWIELVAFISLVMMIVIAVRRKTLPITKGQLLLSGIVLFYGFTGLLGYLAFPEAEAEKKYLRELKTLIIGIVLILSIAPAKANNRKILWACLVLFVIGASFSVILDVHWHNKFRPGIGTSLVIPTSNVLVIALALVWVLWPFASWRTRLLYAPLGLAASYAIVLSETRGAWLNYLALAGLLIWMSITSLRTRVFLLAILILLLPAMYFIPQVEKRVDKAVSNITTYSPGNSHTSLGLRLEFWKTAVNKLKQDPLTARGYKPANVGIKGEFGLEHGNHAHNELLQQWLQKGILGLVAILLLLAAPLLAVDTSGRKAALVLGTGTFMAGLTNVFLFHNLPMLFYLVCISLLRREKPDNFDQSLSESRHHEPSDS